MLCALGLAIGFRANVWNIGAEGQLIIGAHRGRRHRAVRRRAWACSRLPLMLLAGMLGGMAWAAIAALLRTRFHTSEILVTLMLVYIAQLLLSYLVHGPWRDPAGFNFPQSEAFDEHELLPLLFEGARVNIAFVIALVLAVAGLVVRQPQASPGYRMRVAGLAPAAAAYAGFSDKRNIWLALLISGATAGLAGICEVAGPDRPAVARHLAGLRLRCDHRRVRRSAASGRRRARVAADVGAVSRRRIGADRAAAARRRSPACSKACCCSICWRPICSSPFACGACARGHDVAGDS